MGIWSDAAAVAAYDCWFDQERGRAVFATELACLQPLTVGHPGSWIEVGIGTGRFAEALGIGSGVDTSAAMVECARGRGVDARVAPSHATCWPAASLDGILMVMSACYLGDLTPTLAEARRILRADGRLVIGEVTPSGSWGRAIAAKRSAGNPWYMGVTLREPDEWLLVTRELGWRCADVRSGLFGRHDSATADLTVREGIDAGAGFVAFAWELDRCP